MAETSLAFDYDHGVAVGVNALTPGESYHLLSQSGLQAPFEDVYTKASAMTFENDDEYHQIALVTGIRTVGAVCDPSELISDAKKLLEDDQAGLIRIDTPFLRAGLGSLVVRELADVYDQVVTNAHYFEGGKDWIIQSVIEDHQWNDEDFEAVKAMLNQHLFVLSGLTNAIAARHESGGRPVPTTLLLRMPEDNIPEETDHVEVQNNNTDAFEQFVGIDSVVGRLRDVVLLADASEEFREENSVELVQAVLLYGPSGVGKSHLMDALGEQLGADVRKIAFSDVTATHVGEWAKNIAKVFDSAFAAEGRVLIVLDEIEGLLVNGNPDSTANITAVLKTKLEELKDHPNVFVVGATNNVDSVDPVVRASKRIPLQIPLGLPTDVQRRDLFEDLLIMNGPTGNIMNAVMQESVFDIGALSDLTEGFSQGEIIEILESVRRERALAILRKQELPDGLTQLEITAAIKRAKETKS